SYEFLPGAPPACHLTLSFDPTSYVAGAGLSAAAAVRNAAARACRYAAIYQQVRQPDVTVTLTSSLDQPSAAEHQPLPPPTPYPVPKQPLLAMAGSAYALLSAAQA